MARFAIRILSGFVQARALSLVTSEVGKFWANDGAQHAITPSRPKTSRIVGHSLVQWDEVSENPVPLQVRAASRQMDHSLANACQPGARPVRAGFFRSTCWRNATLSAP